MTADKLRIVACIDGSRAAPAVCDFAAWASRHMDTPLMLLHVLDEERYPAEPDLAGSIGLGSPMKVDEVCQSRGHALEVQRVG